MLRPYFALIERKHKRAGVPSAPARFIFTNSHPKQQFQENMFFSNNRQLRRALFLFFIFPLFVAVFILIRENAFSAAIGGPFTQYIPFIRKPVPPPATFIPAGAVWKYLDDGSDQGVAWREPAYDDSVWAQGSAQLGYGDGDETTILSYGPDAANKYITTYFRNTFTVTYPSDFTMLAVYLMRDDGAVVYLNGQEVFRSNMPTGAIDYLTLSAGGTGGVAENLWHNFMVDPAYLVAGANVLSVEIHQTAPTSSDISFDLIMTGMPAGYDMTTYFAAIGDYGLNTTDEGAVASMVAGWNPEYIITLGDNNYPAGTLATLSQNITAYYGSFIENTFQTTRFFPALGNHDWGEGGVQSITCTGSNCTGPYLDYFALSGNERYYDFVKGPIHFFVLDSDPREPDGITASSVQALWFREALANSTSPWNVVYFHHPPYSSGVHGNTLNLQWPFKDWGADLVLAGHDHNYERIILDDFTYIVNGSGGATLRMCQASVAGSQICNDADYGAMLITADACHMNLSFLSATTPAVPYIDTVLLDNGVCQ